MEPINVMAAEEVLEACGYQLAVLRPDPGRMYRQWVRRGRFVALAYDLMRSGPVLFEVQVGDIGREYLGHYDVFPPEELAFQVRRLAEPLLWGPGVRLAYRGSLTHLHGAQGELGGRCDCDEWDCSGWMVTLDDGTRVEHSRRESWTLTTLAALTSVQLASAA